ncbi:YwqG family protein [Psychrobacter sp. I-STPA10]|uniref:YwqG family protein n=1 Tax=Psychrobacter sp. I-STPA10 TaxID=2585769 RepID=UPI001E6211D2|nr:DUF1963 domain-containing protein [Psychrobacter sp. I-STPA10]
MSNQENLISLPAPIQALLEQSKVNVVSISLQKADKELALTASKIGGFGYLPENETYPSKANGTPLALLVQINFAEVAGAVDLSQLPQPLPESGILQIYIDGEDDLYGADFDNPFPSEKYQVRFWQDITLPVNQTALEQAKADLEKLANDNGDYYLPFNHIDEPDELAITFKLAVQSCNIDCYEYEKLKTKIIPDIADKDIEDYIEEYAKNNNLDIADPYDTVIDYGDLANCQGHQLLGYPFFTQCDLRYNNASLANHILLLQIDTDDKANLMWGDSGIANFFITPNELKNKNFSRLVYNWDCY